MYRIALLFIVLFLWNTCVSQTSEKYTVGLSFGFTYSNIYGDNLTIDAVSGLNYRLGGLFGYHLNDNLSAKVELNFERKSFRTKISSFNPQANDDLANERLKSTLEYLTTPILLQYKFGSQRNFFVNAGPYAALFLNSKARFRTQGVSVFNDEDFNTVDFGLAVGAGTVLEFTDYNWLLIELRYNHGLGDINKANLVSDGGVRIHGLHFVVTWEIYL